MQREEGGEKANPQKRMEREWHTETCRARGQPPCQEPTMVDRKKNP